jgi:hypothetical protein
LTKEGTKKKKSPKKKESKEKKEPKIIIPPKETPEIKEERSILPNYMPLPPNLPSFLFYGLKNSMNPTTTTSTETNENMMNFNPLLLQLAQNARLFPIKNKKEEVELKQKKKKLRTKEIPEGQEMIDILTENLLDEVADHEVDNILNSIISKFSTEKAFELHEVDEFRQDKFRKELLNQWETIEEEQNWRLNWLNIRIEQLNKELDETNEKLTKHQEDKTSLESPSRLSQMKTKNSTIVKNNIVTLEQFPPQLRTEEIKFHPMFSTNVSMNNTRVLKEEVLNSLRFPTIGTFHSKVTS